MGRKYKFYKPIEQEVNQGDLVWHGLQIRASGVSITISQSVDNLKSISESIEEKQKDLKKPDHVK
jgi:hypothetical protein